MEQNFNCRPVYFGLRQPLEILYHSLLAITRGYVLKIVDGYGVVVLTLALATGSYDFQFVFHCANLPRFLSRRFRHPNRRLENLDHCPVLLGLRAFHFA